MNGQSICREPMDNGHRCTLHWGHHGDHWCCSLHNKPRWDGQQ